MKKPERLIPIIATALLAGCITGTETEVRGTMDTQTGSTVSSAPRSLFSNSSSSQKIIRSASMLGEELKAKGLIVTQGSAISQPFFRTDAEVLIIDGAQLQVFSYENDVMAQFDAMRVSRNGRTIGTTMITWANPPHFFSKGNLIVLFLGNDMRIIDALEEIFGEQFAGGPITRP